MFTKIEAENTSSSNYLLNSMEVEYEEFTERMEEIIQDQSREVDHFGKMQAKAEEDGHKLAASHYAKRYLEIHEKTLSNIDALDFAREMKDSVIFMMNGAVPSFVYVGRKKKMEHRKAKEDMKKIYV